MINKWTLENINNLVFEGAGKNISLLGVITPNF
jgi:hypothetical protein